MQYGIEQFENDMSKMKPRFTDTWILPPLMMWFASNAKQMPKWPRRMLFAGGVYMFYRNYFEYKKAIQKVVSTIKTTDPVVSTIKTTGPAVSTGPVGI